MGPANPRALLWRGALSAAALASAVAAGAAILASTEASRASLGALLAGARPLPLLAGLALISAASVVAALRWRALLPPAAQQAGVGVLTAIQCVAVLLGYALPGPLGELVAALMVQRRTGAPLAGVLVASLVTRLLGLGVAGALAAICLFFVDFSVDEAWKPALGLTTLGLLAVAGGVAAAALVPGPFRRLVTALTGPLGRLGERAARGAGAVLDALEASAERGWRPLAAATAWTFVGHTLSPGGLALAAHGLGVPAGLGPTVFTNNFATVGSLALVLVPGGQWGWDLLYGATLSIAAGIASEEAAALTALARLQQTALVLVGAGALMVMARDLLPDAVEAPR